MPFNWDEHPIEEKKSTGAFNWNDHPVEKKDVSRLESGLRGAAQGLSFGFSDEATGALEAAKDWLSKDPAGFMENYRQHRDESRVNNKEAEAANPKTYMAGQFGGVIAPAVLSAGGSLPASVGSLAAEGAAQGLGSSEADLTQGDISGAARDFGIGSAIGGATGVIGEKVLAPAISKGVPLLKKGIESVAPSINKATDYLLKKAGNILTGVPEKYSSEYLKRGGNVVARPAEQIMDDLTGRFGEAESKYLKAKDAVGSSKENVSYVENSLKDQLRDKKYDLQNKLSESRDSLDNAYKGQVESLKSHNLNGMTGEIDAALKDLKDTVNKGSSQAYDALAADPTAVYNLDAVKNSLKNEMQELTINGTPVSDSAVSSLKSLNSLSDRISSLGSEINGTQVKKILQQLDKDLESVYGANVGTYAPEADAVKAKIRRMLDTDLKKSNPEYASIMGDVAKDASLLNLASKSFGNEQATLSRLGSLASNKGKEIDAVLLKSLGKRTGRDFETPVNEFIKSRDIMGSPNSMQQLKQSLPEYGAYSDIETQLSQARDPSVLRNIQEDPSVLNAASGLAQDQGALATAEDSYNILKNVAPGQVQSKMKSLTGARDYAPTQVFEDIDRITGQPFSQEIKDRALLDSFNKNDMNGARKTLVGTAVGTAVGGPFGGAIGAAAGATADKYGGKIFKKILDSKISLSDNLADIVQKAPQMLGKFAKPLQDAAARGGNSLAATNFVLQQTNPEYREMMLKSSEDQGQ